MSLLRHKLQHQVPPWQQLHLGVFNFMADVSCHIHFTMTCTARALLYKRSQNKTYTGMLFSWLIDESFKFEEEYYIEINRPALNPCVTGNRAMRMQDFDEIQIFMRSTIREGHWCYIRRDRHTKYICHYKMKTGESEKTLYKPWLCAFHLLRGDLNCIMQNNILLVYRLLYSYYVVSDPDQLR